MQAIFKVKISGITSNAETFQNQKPIIVASSSTFEDP